METGIDGPILMANLPVGNFTVLADSKGNEKERTVNDGSRGKTEVTFTCSAD